MQPACSLQAASRSRPRAAAGAPGCCCPSYCPPSWAGPWSWPGSGSSSAWSALGPAHAKGAAPVPSPAAGAALQAATPVEQARQWLSPATAEGARQAAHQGNPAHARPTCVLYCGPCSWRATDLRRPGCATACSCRRVPSSCSASAGPAAASRCSSRAAAAGPSRSA
jgi:hypothetical protein